MGWRSATGVLLLGVFIGGLWLIHRFSRKEATVVGPSERSPIVRPVGNEKSAAFVFSESRQCAECHAEIYDEWQNDEHATAWTGKNFQAFTENYGRVECLSCHAPRPILEVGLNKVAELRNDRREEGVGCITCHVKAGAVYGPNGGAGGCKAQAEPALKTSQACFPCHSTHDLFNEYLTTDASKNGVTCQACHMDKLRRPSVAGGAVRDVRRHFFRGGRDLGTLQEALILRVKVENGAATVAVTNRGAAHGVPGEINNRRLRCVTVVLNPEGQEVRAFTPVIFQAPPRLQRGKIKSTQLQYGETKTLTYPLPIAHGRVETVLEFQLEWFPTAESEFVTVHKSEDDF